MQIENNSHKKIFLRKALIIIATIAIIIAFLLIYMLVSNDAKIQISKKQDIEIEANQSSIPNNLWDISENGDGSVVARLSEDGTLTISGTGKMKNYGGLSNNSEWFEMKDKVKSVIIEQGITNIGWYAFSRCTNLTSIEIPNTVTDIGFCAFEECTSLTNIEIPDSVTRINFATFMGCTSLTNIEIPNSVTNIEGSAFRACTSLISINISNVLTSIGDYAFYECTSLTNIEIPSSVTSIGDYAFNECTSLTGINVDENNKYYMDDNGVLYTKGGQELIKCPGGKKETTYIVLSGTTQIRDYAFEKCINLTSVEIPNSVISIGDWVFAECTNLTNIEIPNSVTSIVDLMFYECTNLTNINIPNSVTSIEWNAFEGCTSLTSINIPNSVTNIGSYAFERCTSLTNINIPNSVTNIGYFAFGECTNLKSIEIPDSVTSIGSRIFEKCTSLESIEIPNSITTLTFSAFKECTSLTNIIIPNSITDIEAYAFEKCTSLTSVEIPNSVTNIGWYAFKDCANLTDIVIRNRMLRIGGDTFSGCPNLTIYCTSYSYAKQYAIINNIRYILDDEKPTITSVDGNPTEWTNKDVTLTINAEDNIVGLAKEPYSFDGGKTWQAENTKTYTQNTAGIIIKVKDKLDNIYTHETIDITKIDKQAPTWDISRSRDGSVVATLSKDGILTISGMGKMNDWNQSDTPDWFEIKEQIQSVIIEEGVTNIGDFAFDECTSLTNIKIPNTVTSIGHIAFYECTSLIDIEIPNSVTSIGDSAFNRCTSLKNIVIPNSVTSIGNSAFMKCTSLADVLISNNVIDIKPLTFFECKNLKSIEIPNSITSIERYAFGDCSNLISIKIPNGVTNIDYGVFMCCTSLTSIELPNSVTNIGECAFLGCTNLTKIKIPNSVISIRESALKNCTSLTNIEIPNSVTSIERYVFDGCSSLTSIEVDESNKNYMDYNGVLYAKDKSEIVRYPEGKQETQYTILSDVRSIGRYAFKGCTNLTSLKILNGVTNIGDSAFEGCTGLTNIDIPNSVTNLGHNAFFKCSSLANVVIPNSVTSIGICVSLGCPNLTIYCTSNSYAKKYAINNNIKYVIDDEAPTITSVVGNQIEWINQDVILTINAGDGLSGLAEKPYSFDGGRTWQTENTKIYTNNSAGIIIKVKDKLDNIYTHDVLHVLKIDKQAPKITSVTGKIIEWTDNHISLTITASDSFSGLAEKPYSFDGGRTWQAENTKTYTGNINEIIIKVKDKAGNIATYDGKININKRVSIITSVTGNPTEWTNKDVTLTINAEDNVIGLAEKPYSFDGGRTWQAENTKTYTQNTAGIIIKVKDKLDNIYTHETIDITKIDKQAPKITNVVIGSKTWTKKGVVVTITAKDGLSGLADKPYSFDGGKTWQAENTNTYSISTAGIKVKDKAGNIVTYRPINLFSPVKY